MNKGKILKITNQYAIIYSDSLAYHKIKLKSQMAVGQTIFYFDDDIMPPANTKQERPSRYLTPSFFAFKFVPVLAIVLIGIMLMNHQQILPTTIPTYGVVSIDINPSISLLVTQDGIIEYAHGKNEGGQQLLSTLELTDIPLHHAIEKIITASEEDGFLDEHHKILIATAEKSNQHIISDLVEDILESSSLDDPYTIYVAEVAYTVYEKAENEHVTIGQYLMKTSVGDSPYKSLDEDTLDRIIENNDAPIKKREKQIQKKEDQKQKKETLKETITEKQENKKNIQKEKQENKKKEIKEKQNTKQKNDKAD